MRSILAIVSCACPPVAHWPSKRTTIAATTCFPTARRAIDGSSGDLNVWVGQCSGAIAALTFMAPALNASERSVDPRINPCCRRAGSLCDIWNSTPRPCTSTSWSWHCALSKKLGNARCHPSDSEKPSLSQPSGGFSFYGSRSIR